LRRSLQLIALFGTTVGTLSALIELTAQGFQPADPTTTATVFWVFGVAWGLASDRAMLRPVRAGMVLGTLTAVIAPYGIAAPTGFEIPSETTITVAAVWSFATSALVLAFGTVRGDRAVQGIAIVGVIIGTGVIVGNNFTESDAATIVALVVGLALLGTALVAIRSA
jgi:peptidoglycan/LPS O-acetylase OafA/YrhL